jgi:hypothetical protein
MAKHEQNDYIFVGKGQLLAEETCDEHEAAEMAQAFAQEYGTILYARTVKVTEPRKCDNCGATLNTDYTCPDCGYNR